jgi:ATP-binding cassette, subfamily B, multidrug efflux pump
MEQEAIEVKQYSLKDTKILKGLLGYIKPYRVHFLFIIILDIFVNLAFTLDPLIVKYMMDYLAEVNSSTGNPLLHVTLIILIDVILWIVGAIGGYYVNLELKKIGQNVVKDMRDDLFSHVLNLSLADLRKLKIGSYVTRITNDTQNISSLFSDILPQFLRALLSLFVIIFTTFIITQLYGFIFLAYIPIVFVVSYFFRKKSRTYYRGERKAISEMNSFLSESFQGVKVTKTYNREEKKQEEFQRKNEDIRRTFVKSQNLFAFYYPFMYLLQISCVLIVFAFCIPNLSTDGGVTGISLGTFQMLYSYSTQFFQPIQTITQLMNMLQQTISSAERILVVQEEKEEVEDEDGTIDVDAFKGKIEFRNVYFAYEKEDYVLKDVSFVINPGKTAAFVGATGAGKSTIISLISRTYEINKGEILIDDIPLKKYSMECLRRNIGMMLQDVFIFSGNIKDNISLGSETVSDEEIYSACKYVGADSFIEKLPEKYETKVTERGENFSAGQRQLISFARTIVYHPTMVLLDEATANIDTETENIIQTSLEKMRSIGTMIIVAHRLSTIKNADIIFVVSKGRIIEQGNHQQLLKNKGNYYNLYRLQNMEENMKKDEETKNENHQII